MKIHTLGRLCRIRGDNLSDRHSAVMSMRGFLGDRMSATILTRRCTIALALLGFASPTWAGNAIRDIAVGGVDGFDIYSDAAASSQLRATKRARLYVHDFIWQRLTEDRRKAIVAAFSGTGPASLEVGVSSHSQPFWEQHFQTYAGAGLIADQAHANLAQGAAALSIPQWRAFVDAGKLFGLKMVAPIFAPNDREWMTRTFNSPSWNALKSMAEYGGGLTIDSPPWYYLTHPKEYQAFVQAEVKWSRAAGITSTWIVSPPRVPNGKMLGPTMEMLTRLTSDNALPDQFIVENYMASPPIGFRNVVGNDRTPDTISSVALWMAQHIGRR